MQIIDYFCTFENAETTHTWMLATHNESDSPLDGLAECLADKIVQQQCIGTPQYYEEWKEKAINGISPKPNSQKALLAFLKPVFGNRDDKDSIPANHLQGYIGEMLWFFLVQECAIDEIVHIDPPSFKVTEQGGDGFIIHRSPSGSLLFRLWEMKKFVPISGGSSTHISGTIGTAYSQLNERAMEYLARYTKIGEKFIHDTPVASFCGQIIELWLDASPQASLGVSVVTSAAHVPQRAFSTFGTRFPDFAQPVRLRGMLTATDDFADFADKVRECVWKGL